MQHSDDLILTYVISDISDFKMLKHFFKIAVEHRQPAAVAVFEPELDETYASLWVPFCVFFFFSFYLTLVCRVTKLSMYQYAMQHIHNLPV